MIKATLLSLMLAALPLTAHADQMLGVGIHPDDFYVYDLNGRLLFVDDRPILTLIGTFEGPDGYDTVYYGSKVKPEKPITEMTIEELQNWQDRSVNAGAKSSAAGVYQFIRKTLRSTIEKAGISRSVKFDRFTQDRLARFALRSCGFYKHTRPDTEIANCLAATWAALPVVTGPRAGQSRYQGVAGNKSLTSVESVMKTVQGRFRDIAYAGELRNYRPTPVQDMSRTAAAEESTVVPTSEGIVFSVRAPTPEEIALQRAEMRRDSYERRRTDLRPFSGYVRGEERQTDIRRPEIVMPANKINP